MMDVTREEVKRIIDFLRENPVVAREFGVVVNAGVVERIDAFETVMEKHFEESSARFAALDAKFNELVREMHEGFEEARREREKGFDEARREREKGFEEAKKEREAGFAAANRKSEEHDRKFEALIKKMDEGFAVAAKERGSLGKTLGRLLEDRVRDRTEDYAERAGWMIDTRIVRGGEEIDMLVRDGISFFIETKSHADIDSLEQTARKSKKLKMPGILVGERIDRGVIKEARKRNILCLGLYELRSALRSGRIKKFYTK